MAKKYEGFGPIETLANTRADLLIQKRKELEEKIKLDNKLINTGYGEFFKKWRFFNWGYLKRLYQVQEVGVTNCYINILKFWNQFGEAVQMWSQFLLALTVY